MGNEKGKAEKVFWEVRRGNLWGLSFFSCFKDILEVVIKIHWHYKCLIEAFNISITMYCGCDGRSDGGREPLLKSRSRQQNEWKCYTAAHYATANLAVF